MPGVKLFAVINQKGGVGKTTTVANLGAALAAAGHPTCLLDLDPQAHLTLHFGVEPDALETSVYDVLVEQAPLGEASMLVGQGLWVTPATIDLAAAEVELVTTVGREQLLADAVAAADLPCEFAFIDCPPSLGLLTLNALAAADEVFIPVQPHFLALQGLGKLLETVSLVRKRINPDLRVGGVILCMYESTTRLSSEVVADLQEFFAGARGADVPWAEARIFGSRIRRNVKLAESPSYGQTVLQYAPSSNGALDYRWLAEEFLEQYAPAHDRREPDAEDAPDDRPPAPVEGPAEAEADPPAPRENLDLAVSTFAPLAQPPADTLEQRVREGDADETEPSRYAGEPPSPAPDAEREQFPSRRC